MSEHLRQITRRRSDISMRIALRVTACFRLQSEGVTGLLIYLLLLLATTGAQQLRAQSGSSTRGVMLQSGIEKEDVDGDLKGAMSIYERIAADATAPREVRAKALLRLAGCDEKLGKQAKQVYEQIVRDYSDQAAAAQARSRLAAIRQQEHPAPPETMSMRKMDREKVGVFGPQDTDGYRATYIATDGNLYFGDVSGHARSLVYGPGDPEFRKSPAWAASRDLTMVALMLPQSNTRPVTTLAIAKIDGTGYREVLHDDEQGNILGGNNEFAVTWSWDNRNLLVFTPGLYFSDQKDTCPRLWLVTLADGKRRELVHEDSKNCIARAVFSPDGQFAAYESRPRFPFPQVATSKVFIVAIKGGEPHLVYESDPWQDHTEPFGALADWTADGRYLAIKGIHEGSHALFLLPIKNGAANELRVFMRIGDFENASSTPSGALIFEDTSTPVPDDSLHLARIDGDGKIEKWTRIDLSRRAFHVFPSFSPDSSQIAYEARNLHSTGTDLILKDAITGRERIVYESGADHLNCEYSAIRPVVFCTTRVGTGKTDLVSVSADTGAVEQISTFPDQRYLFRGQQDDRTFYFAIDRGLGPYFDPEVRWDRIAQKDTAAADAAELKDNLSKLSLDGRWVLRQINGDLSFRAASGGDWRTLVSGVENYLVLGSTPDGNSAVYMASDPQGHPGLFEAPFSGGEPRRMGDLPNNYRFAWDFLIFSPDGRNVIVASPTSSPAHNLWVLENFEPKIRK